MVSEYAKHSAKAQITIKHLELKITSFKLTNNEPLCLKDNDTFTVTKVE